MPAIKCPKCGNTFDFSKYEFDVASELACSDEIEKECPFCEYVIKIKKKKKETSFKDNQTQELSDVGNENVLFPIKKNNLSVAGKNANSDFDLQLDRSGELSFIQKTKAYIFGEIKSDKKLLLIKETSVIISILIFASALFFVYKTDFSLLRKSILDFLISFSG